MDKETNKEEKRGIERKGKEGMNVGKRMKKR